MVVGPSCCGKTVFVKKLFQDKDIYFNKPIKRVIWCYGEVKPALTNAIFIKGIPDISTLKEGDLCILDDLAFDSANNKDVTAIFTKVSHNRKLFTIFITQNMFHQGGQSRTRSLNTHYFVLFRNPRDTTQILHLSRQMGAPHLPAVFEDITKNKPFAYILLDLTTTTHDNYRIRTGMLKGEKLNAFINNNKDVNK